MLIEDIISTVVGLILIVVVLGVGLGLLSIQRRVTRTRYFRSLDAARQRVKELLDSIDEELTREPQRIRELYEVKAQRIEPVGLVYLWPVTG